MPARTAYIKHSDRCRTCMLAKMAKSIGNTTRISLAPNVIIYHNFGESGCTVFLRCFFAFGEAFCGACVCKYN